MIAGLMYRDPSRPLCRGVAILTGALVYQVGIFEGLLAAMAIHAAVHYLVCTQVNKQPTKVIVGNYFANLNQISAES